MRNTVSRADIIRGRFSGIPDSIRPPYAIAEEDFRARCEPCGDCRKACETGVIGQDGEGFPILLFGQAECSFCGRCAEVCTTGAFRKSHARPWVATAHVKSNCLSFNAITCRSCEENCEAGAIRFRLMTQGRALPLIDAAACTGCGNCAVICPNQSIEMKNRETEEVFA